MEQHEYSYEHLIKKCELTKNHRDIYFSFIQSLFEITGDLDEVHEKNISNKDTKKLAHCVGELSDNIKGELWRELERQSLDVIYEKEILAITRNQKGDIIS